MTLEFTSRLVNAFVLDANLHIGRDWYPAALARWTSMMPFSSRLVQELVHAARISGLGDAGNSVKLVLVW